MPSTSTSRRLLVSGRGLRLSFRTDIYRPWTWKEAASRLGQAPRKIEELKVLDGIDFDVFEGERVGILGVNGVGKTSLCRCVAGFYQPTAGKVRVHGEVRAIFDTAFGIQPELTGRENAELLSEFLYPGDFDKTELIEDALDFSELGHFLDVPFRLYSNGMQARLCLSLISCRPCDLLILDEVFEGADAFFRTKIARRILNMIEHSGAVLFVSHTPEQIKTVCNRLIVLHQGKIAFDGDVDEGLAFYGGFSLPAGAQSTIYSADPEASPR